MQVFLGAVKEQLDMLVKFVWRISLYKLNLNDNVTKALQCTDYRTYSWQQVVIYIHDINFLCIVDMMTSPQSLMLTVNIS